LDHFIQNLLPGTVLFVENGGNKLFGAFQAVATPPSFISTFRQMDIDSKRAPNYSAFWQLYRPPIANGHQSVIWYLSPGLSVTGSISHMFHNSLATSLRNHLTIRLFDNSIIYQADGGKNDIVPTLCVPILMKKFINDNVPIWTREELDGHPWPHESQNRPEYTFNRNFDDLSSLKYACKSWKKFNDGSATS
jgi:hypothetical protein